MSAYYGTWRVISAQPVPSQLLALSRKLVGGMIERNIESQHLRLADGTLIKAQIVDSIPKVTIVQAADAQEQQAEATDLWVPRGFLVYPAWSDAPGGVGLPIIPAAGKGAYDPANLAPGIDRYRWTAGGPCGEVLLSPDLDAGYPTNDQAIVVPLLYDPIKGPVFQWNGDGFYDNRDQTGTWSAYRMELSAPVTHYPDEDLGAITALYEGVNAYRVANSLPALTLQPRGYYHPAQVMVSIMQAAGSIDAYNAGYPQGYLTTADRLTKDGYSATLMGGSFASFNRGDNPTSIEMRALGGSASSLITTWQGIPERDAELLKDVGRGAFSDVGNRAGFWAMDVISRTSWIGAGNCSWQSADYSLPTLSWHGFASMNLAWETYPATYDIPNYATAPLIPYIAFTDANGDCWLNYPRTAAPTAADIEPGMSRQIYLRGRSIALAPRGGLVWGACIQANGATDRLIALVHHPEDQPSDYTTNGWTRYLRVWWCDIPLRSHLRADPEQTICGEDLSDPLSWRGGVTVDVGHMPPPTTGGTVAPGVTSSLKYASQWRFNGDGTRAVCLRDYGLYAEYSSLWSAGLSPASGMEGRAVELVFSSSGADLNISTVWHDYTGNPAVNSAYAGVIMQWRAVAQAVDYDSNGSLVFAFSAGTDESGSGPSLADTFYLGTGSASTQWYTDMKDRAQYGALSRTDVENFRPSDIAVADVLSNSWVVGGMRPRSVKDSIQPNPDWIMCWPFTDVLAYGVRMYVSGNMLDERWFPIPDGVVVAPSLSCNSPQFNVASSLLWLPLAASVNLQAFHAKRFGETVFSYQHSPVPQASRVLDSNLPAASPYNNCGCEVSYYDIGNRAHWMTYGEFNPRGGHTISSVPLPNNDWLIYAKVL